MCIMGLIDLVSEPGLIVFDGLMDYIVRRVEISG